MMRVHPDFKKLAKDFKKKNDLASDTQATKQIAKMLNKQQNKLKLIKEIRF